MRELYTSDADTVALNNGVPSRAIHRVIPAASRTRTLLEMATWVCRSGSPARESRWVNAAAIRPSVSTWAMPSVPNRDRHASRSMNASASATAWRWAASIFSAIGSGATAHNADTDFTGLNVMS